MKTLKIFAAGLIAALAVSCGTSKTPSVEAPLPSKGEVDSVSYYIGVNFGSMLKGYGWAEKLSDINMAELKRGMKDFLEANGTPDPNDSAFTAQFRYDLQDMNTSIQGYMTKLQNYKAEVKKAEEVAWFEENAKKEGVQQTESGLQYIIQVEGEGEKVTDQDTVVVNYKGTLLDGTVFDENDSTTFAANRVITGWTEGLGLLGKGGKATLYIPYELAYGERGTYGIEPFSTLIFDVEVLDVKKYVAPVTE